MDRLFLDTNVLLDVLEKRAPWYPDSSECLARIRKGSVKGAMTALSLSDIAYIHKPTSTSTLTQAFCHLREFMDIAPLNPKTVDAALAMSTPDLEDNFQYAAAMNWGATHLLTRNTKDFPNNSKMAIISPADYLRNIL